jgi:hypothetical protein
MEIRPGDYAKGVAHALTASTGMSTPNPYVTETMTECVLYEAFHKQKEIRVKTAKWAIKETLIRIARQHDIQLTEPKDGAT